MTIVWRMNLHTHEGPEKQYQVLEYCKRLGILGIGWHTTDTIVDLYSDFEEFARKNATYIDNKTNLTSFKKVVMAFNRIKKDDLIWTRCNGIYYLCRVLDDNIIEYCIDTTLSEQEKQEHNENDIWHGRKCEIIKIGTQEKIIGSIVDSFNVGTICQIQKNKEFVKYFSEKLYNESTETDYRYNLGSISKLDSWDKFWGSLRNEQLETLVITYLQCNYDLKIYSYTCKKNTQATECVLFDSYGNNYYVQVKQCGIDVCNAKYKNIYDENKFFFFSKENSYGNYDKNNKNIVIIEKRELEDFVKNNKKIVGNFLEQILYNEYI